MKSSDVQQKTAQLYQALQEKTIATTPIYQGRVISLQVDDVTLPNGKVSQREIVTHPGAVAIMVIQNDRLLVVSQYRKALDKIQMEIPAGKLESAEQLETAAKRELEEETGYRAAHLQHVCSFYTSPGFANEILHLYFTDTIEQGNLQLDEDEFIESAFISFDEAQLYVANGLISDAKTMLAIFAWQSYRLTGAINTFK